MRASILVLECARLLLSESRSTGLFANDAPDPTADAGGEATSQRQP